MEDAPWGPVGLYHPRWEHDACGIGFVARTDGTRSHEVLKLALDALCNLEHRGAINADGKTGDGAGILTQLPYDLLAAELRELGIAAPPPGDLGLAQCFLPVDVGESQRARRLIEQALNAAGIPLLRWRAVPTNNVALGARALATKPALWQALVARPPTIPEGDAWERALYLVRRDIRHAAREHVLAVYLPSFSARTVVYKGLMAATQLDNFYLDLRNPLYRTTLALYHQRFATNTMPTWELAQPFRLLCHNGEINTLAGNVADIRAREPLFDAPVWGEAVARVRGAIDVRGSDSAILDNVLELLVRSGRDVPHALAMMVPEAWEEMNDFDPDLRAFYRYHAGLLSPWDGPAALCFSDGRLVGAALDRNGLRPQRYFFTDDGLVVSGSEAGAVPIDDRRIVRKGRLGPGEMLVVDTASGEVFEDSSIKRDLAGRAPYADWLREHGRTLEAPAAEPAPSLNGKVLPFQTLYGYTAEDVQVLLKPMARDGHEPVGSMGDDTPVGPLTQVGRPLYSYLRQQFAQVTNPPIDPLREQLVMSLRMRLGRRGNILQELPEHAHLLEIHGPILLAHELQALARHPEFPSRTLRAVWNVADGEAGLRSAVARLQQEAATAVSEGAALLIISDRPDGREEAPIPALLALGGVHQHLLRSELRALCSLIVETGEARDVHQIACLIGNGAEAIHPFLALESVRHLADEERQRERLDPHTAQRNYVHAIEEGLRKIMSKMGIATLDSYHGAQLFEAVGLSDEIVDECLTGTATRLAGIGWADVAADVARAHATAWSAAGEMTALRHAGIYKWKKDGEYHAHHPATVHAMHAAIGLKPYKGDLRDAYRAYTKLIHARPPLAPRDLLRPRPNALGRGPVPLDEVEPVSDILRRFSTAAMSHGSTSIEAHMTLAIAMARLGGLSNSGEGGEDPARFGVESNSTIKQVASGRFGVTPAYLMSARELQIKMAQGSKPGEGGQLPGHKVSEEIARIRHTTPGVTLISPPPHHDIYSIEDLAQLIWDLKQINPVADVSVKLVAEAGVGTIAAGVVKAGADIVLISGHSGGTGASPLSSIKNAGVAWELGLAETQQTLTLNGLRERARLRTDGGLQTGRDVLIAALLGADEYSFGTAAVVAEGCLMARSCHTNTCPVGIATQRPDLRAKFPGTPESVMH
ncbi:MAG: glutamate synthase large subunit, partial [Chloroflexota bacterium]|nr:glutamate synthase large subunit [Chloroflexota bacterium]